MVPLEAEHGWEWFDPIREDPRFKACVERMRRFVVPVTAGGEKTFPEPLKAV
jgi:hypothetical protein